MIDQRVLQKAVADGVIDDKQAERISTIAAEIEANGADRGDATEASAQTQAEASLPRDPENLRFVRGFADIFVTIGIALVIGPAIYFGDLHFEDTAMVAGVIGLGAWLLAEYFTRIRLMALPSIALLLVFAAAGAVFFLDLAIDLEGPLLDGLALFDGPPLPAGSPLRELAMRAALAAVLTAGTVAVYYWRFRVPIAVAAGTAALVALVLAGVTIAVPELTEAHLRWLLLACGLGVFVLAMRFDMSDPQRLTRRTDIAFWLHVLAAPLIVHPVLSGVSDAGPAGLTFNAALGVLALFAVIGLVSVMIDRRSFLVAGLSYAGFAFRSLLGDAGILDSAVPATLLILGALILALSAGWAVLRRVLMSLVPQQLAERLPPTRTLRAGAEQAGAGS